MLKIETKDYDSPSTRRTIVDLEDGVCFGSTVFINPETDNGKITPQRTNEAFKHEWEVPNWEETNS